MRFILTGGEVSDYKRAIALLSGRQGQAVLADKGYDADYLVEKIYSMGRKLSFPQEETKNSTWLRQKFI